MDNRQNKVGQQQISEKHRKKRMTASGVNILSCFFNFQLVFLKPHFSQLKYFLENLSIFFIVILSEFSLFLCSLRKKIRKKNSRKSNN
tara:strand:- start:529 stop:792 length:264 start_codon:yes stop_codon:yes gene_type:complete